MNGHYSRIVTYLHHAQRKDGGFSSATSSDFMSREKQTRTTTFFTSLILNSLNSACKQSLVAPSDLRKLNAVRRRAATFLLNEKSENWSWNYWSRTSLEAKEIPYPDDLDDTALAVRALHGYDVSTVPPAALASIAHLLIATETQEGGPYRTWLVPSDSPNFGGDVDVVANANIRTLLTDLGVTVPNLDKYIEDRLSNNRIESPYYIGHYPFVYFLSRKDEANDSLRNFLIRRCQKPIPKKSSPLVSALNVVACTRLGVPIRNVEKLKKLFSDVSYDPHPFGVERVEGGKKHMSTCPAFSAALFLEALMALDGAVSHHLPPQKNILVNVLARTRASAFLSESFPLTPPSSALKKTLQHSLLSRLKPQERDDSILLPVRLYESILKSLRKEMSEKMLVTVAHAGWRGWAGYTLMDDIVDGDRGNGIVDMPAAQYLIRASLEGYLLVADSLSSHNRKKLKELIETIFADMDEAMGWELKYCRLITQKDVPQYGDYRMLAKRSMGHAIGAITVLVVSGGISVDSKEVKSMMRFFSHYIIARQLNDDAHDWVADLRAGRINSVAVLLLDMIPKGHKRASLDINKLQKLFWKSGMSRVADLIGYHALQARRAMKPLKSMMDMAFFEAMIVQVEDGAKNALRERESILEFSSSFNAAP
jgi:hypothetical protein